MKRTILFLVILVALVVVFRMWLTEKPTKEVTTAPTTPLSTQVVRLDVGLSPEEEAIWHHHDEGGGFLPSVSSMPSMTPRPACPSSRPCRDSAW